MEKLTIEEIRSGNPRMDTVRISGFMDGELSELKSMEHGEAKIALLDMLDRRNNGTGSYWHNGYGIYGMWFDNEYAYLNIGTTCD